jgi:dTDP-4-dehydrorhamnose 3,5-epimerase-like enzyme
MLKNCTVMTPDIFKDQRGEIYSFFPEDDIKEYNLMSTKRGNERGYHYHPHFNEYITIVDGACIFKEYHNGIQSQVILNTGDSVRIPAGIAHAFVAISDLKFVSMLTQRWNDSNPPIVKVDF